MIAGLDSSLAAPSADQARAAAAAGVRLWSGYISTHSGVGLLASWTQDAFDKARLCGGTPLAFCSGWDDPVALRRLAAQYNVRLCLDVENGIRADGPWVDDFLAQSGAGLYGNFSVHYESGHPVGRGAAFNIAAAYPGFDPHATWRADLPRPAAACGWQEQGTHQEFGVEVDRGWYDDWFLSSSPGGGGNTTLGGIGMGALVGGFFDAATGVSHTFRTSTDGHLLYGRTSGGSGGEVHVGYWDLGAPAVEGGIVDLAAFPTEPGGITILASTADGRAWELPVVDRNAGTPQALTGGNGWWLQEHAGPYRVPAGSKGDPGPQGAPGPPGASVDDQHIRDVAADEIERRLANG